jgi:transposase
MDTSTQGRAKRQYRSTEEKLQIMAEATAPGASVAAVARQHGMNANLIFGWLRLRKAGLLRDGTAPPPLLPVKVTMPTVLPDLDSRPQPGPAMRGQSTGHIAVEIGGLTVRVHGRVDRDALSVVFAALRAR